VQRQYACSAGRITNCQIGVSLTLPTPSTHLPVDLELYLPESWTKDVIRRREGGVPKDVEFRTKPELALKTVCCAARDGLPRGVLLADAGYGNSSDFHAKVRAEGFDYAIAVESTTKVWPAATRRGRPTSVRKLALAIAIRRHRRVT
jgi:SRSO17 transposase